MARVHRPPQRQTQTGGTRRLTGPTNIIIEPVRGWLALDLAELWAHRDLWLLLARRDIQVRYRQTALGVAWALIQPLAAMAIFALVFGRGLGLRPEGQGYAQWVLCGLLPWLCCSHFVSGAAHSLIEQPELLTRVYFPRLLLPLGVLGYVALDTAIAAGLLLFVLAASGPVLTWQLALLPLVGLGVCGVALGAGLWAAALNVKYRDVRYALPFVLQLWFFASPVVYPAALLPGAWRWAAALNPLTGLIEAFRACLLGTPLHLPSFALGLAVSALLALAGLVYFRQVEAHFADLV